MASEDVKVTLLATSDVHGFYQDWDYSRDEYIKRGGLSRVSSLVKIIRNENPNTVLIDCGDLIQGNSCETFLYENKCPGMDVINYMNYDIYNMGNHEFNFGMEKLIMAVKKFKGISMMGNLHREDGSRIMNGIYYKHFGPIKIAFISLNTPLVRHFEDKRGNLKNYIITDADVELKNLLEELDSDYNLLVGIFHMGDKNENNIPNTGAIDLIYNVEGAEKFDIVFGGHMHQSINGMKIRNTLFMEPSYGAKVLNKVDITFNCEKKITVKNIETFCIDIDERFQSDPEIKLMLKPYHDKLRAYANEFVGYTSENLTLPDDIKGLSKTRTSQSYIGDFFLDVMYFYSKADVVALHLDNEYPSIPAGEIRRKHIYNSYSYAGGDISKYVITGRDLRDYMEWSAGYFNQSKQGDITISYDANRRGFKYSTFDIFGKVSYMIDLTKPIGSRIKDLKWLDGRPIDDRETFTIGLNKYRMDFLTSDEGPLHDRKFDMVWSSITDIKLPFRGTIRNLSIDYFKYLPKNTYIPRKKQTWSIKGWDIDAEIKENAIKLINMDILQFVKNKYGENDYTKSINLYDKISEEVYQKLSGINANIKNMLRNDMRNIDIIKLYYNLYNVNEL